jgi:hypothetical protein
LANVYDDEIILVQGEEGQALDLQDEAKDVQVVLENVE